MFKHYYAHEFVPLLELDKSERAKRRAQQKQIRNEGKESKKPPRTRGTNTPRRVQSHRKQRSRSRSRSRSHSHSRKR